MKGFFACLFWFLVPGLMAQTALESYVIDHVEARQLRAWHDMSASEPHVAGGPGDARLVEAMVKAFTEMGLEVEKQPIWVYLPTPGEASLDIVAPVVKSLPLKETAPPGDPANHQRLPIGWNAYSGSGEATAEVVYANYGTKQDFAWLKENGITCEGKIVIARYGRNFRGYKAKFAQAAGAAGLIIYTDPKDSGYGVGIPYPEGGYANQTYIQRGSIKTLPYEGDPLTPFKPATKDAARLDPEEVALPRIPVQPISWQAASEILGRMKGESVSQAWQGGLPFRYRLTGGEDLKVRLRVKQKRELTLTHNVVATLRGTAEQDALVILGSHHDSWGHGASDPTAGLITVLEAARVLSDAAKLGHRLQRSVMFAAWGAEEHGIIGSVEWVETHLERLRKNAVAYVNLDMAAMGPRFRASATPSLQGPIAAAAKLVPQPKERGQTVFASWYGRTGQGSGKGMPRFGDLGGGSDHVGFLALAGVAAAGMGGGGSAGVAYHSNYDHLDWYRKVVGEDYAPAVMVTRAAALTAAKLAGPDLLPLEPERYGPETLRHLRNLTRIGRDKGLFVKGETDIAPELQPVAEAARGFGERAVKVLTGIREHAVNGESKLEKTARINQALMRFDRLWIDAEGLPNRPWFQNLFASTDEDSGYASWMLPGLRFAIEHQDKEVLEKMVSKYRAIFARFESTLDDIEVK